MTNYVCTMVVADGMVIRVMCIKTVLTIKEEML